MGKFTVEQRRLTHRGTAFHFVSYEGQPGNPKREQPPTQPAWFLMREGRSAATDDNAALWDA